MQALRSARDWQDAEAVTLTEELGREMRALVQHLDANIDAMKANLKFSTLVSNLARSYGSQLSAHLAPLRRLVEKLETFLRKSALAVIERLEAKRDA